MTDEFTNNVAQKFPNTQNKETVERPWDVTETKVVASIKRQDDGRREDLTERIHTLYAELRSSLTVRSALEFDLKRAQRILEDLNRVKTEVEKVIEMLRVMEEYMKERIT
ncbi:MAG TPA: hypothetical protein VLK23_15160 [Thermodesulfobacteriota bacterium]|nr:hypothetical protein [Thermodesulfobacteriota bacterium]